MSSGSLHAKNVGRFRGDHADGICPAHENLREATLAGARFADVRIGQGELNFSLGRCPASLATERLVRCEYIGGG